MTDLINWINWNYVGIYLLIAVPVLVLFLRGVDTEASELNEIKSK